MSRTAWKLAVNGMAMAGRRPALAMLVFDREACLHQVIGTWESSGQRGRMERGWYAFTGVAGYARQLLS